MPSHLRNVAKKAALSFVYRFPPLPQRIQDGWVWIHPRARFSISAGTFRKGERHVQEWLAERLKPGDVFFDVGAHHGWVSMWALPLVGEAGAVHSFEPSPANRSILEWHRRVNGFSRWIIISKAVSDEDAPERPFYLIDSGDSPMNSLTAGVHGMPLMEGRDVQKVPIQTVTLDTYCGQAGASPNLVKIDVEGAELSVLRGAERLLRDFRPAIILAVHPYWLPSGQSPAQIAALLNAHGYSMFDATGNPVQRLRSGEYLCLCGRADFTAMQRDV